MIALGVHRAYMHINKFGDTVSLETFERYTDFREYWLSCDYIRRVTKMFKIDYNEESKGFRFLKRFEDMNSKKIRNYFIQQRIYNGTLFRF